jgi:acetyl esterase/lipase
MLACESLVATSARWENTVARFKTSGKLPRNALPTRVARRSLLRSSIGWKLGILGAAILLMSLAFAASAWPSALIVRFIFEAEAAKVKRALEKHRPRGVSSLLNQRYRFGDKDALLDTYFPSAAAQSGRRFPTLIWIHGGGWLSGHRDDVAPYLQAVAAEGYTVISLDYSLAPRHKYPTPLQQVNAALTYIQRNADRLHVDLDRIVIGGDSAGAQITSQIATLATSPTYARELGMDSAIEPGQLRGVILYCGIYDTASLLKNAELTPSRLLRWGTATIIWAYTGSRDNNAHALQQLSTVNHVTADFPPAFISGGSHDMLTDDQSKPLVAKLQALGVYVSTLFYAPGHTPALGHEYQFNLDSSDGAHALVQMLAFLQQRTVAQDVAR